MFLPKAKVGLVLCAPADQTCMFGVYSIITIMYTCHGLNKVSPVCIVKLD